MGDKKDTISIPKDKSHSGLDTGNHPIIKVLVTSNTDDRLREFELQNNWAWTELKDQIKDKFGWDISSFRYGRGTVVTAQSGNLSRISPNTRCVVVITTKDGSIFKYYFGYQPLPNDGDEDKSQTSEEYKSIDNSLDSDNEEKSLKTDDKPLNTSEDDKTNKYDEDIPPYEDDKEQEPYFYVPKTGLINFGLTCYINSALQLLYPHFSKLVTSKYRIKGNLGKIIFDLYEENEKKRNLMNMLTYLNDNNDIAKEIDDYYSMGDVVQFFSCLLRILENEGNDWLVSPFKLKVNIKQCKKCRSPPIFEHFSYLVLINCGQISHLLLYQLYSYFEDYKTCMNCNTELNLEVSIPTHLILQNAYIYKPNKTKMPIDLNIPLHKIFNYTLTSLSISSRLHATTLSKRQNKWYCFNDEEVTLYHMEENEFFKFNNNPDQIRALSYISNDDRQIMLTKKKVMKLIEKSGLNIDAFENL